MQNLSKQIDFNNLVYYFKGDTDPKTLNEIKKTIKSDINKIVKRKHKSEEQKSAIEILKHFKNHEKKLSNCLMIILKLYLKLNSKKMLQRLPIDHCTSKSR